MNVFFVKNCPTFHLIKNVLISQKGVVQFKYIFLGVSICTLFTYTYVTKCFVKCDVLERISKFLNQKEVNSWYLFVIIIYQLYIQYSKIFRNYFKLYMIYIHVYIYILCRNLKSCWLMITQYSRTVLFFFNSRIFWIFYKTFCTCMYIFT